MALEKKPFEDFFEMSEAEMRRQGTRQFTPKETALVLTYFLRWCKANGMDSTKAPAFARQLYMAGLITGICYAGQELRGKYKSRPFG